MLKEDMVEPICREIVHLFNRSDVFGNEVSSKWDGADRSTDLVPMKRKKHDEVTFIRHGNSRARMHVFRIGEGVPDPDTMIVFPKQVLEEQARADASVVIDNLKNGRPSEPQVFFKEFTIGKSELQAFETAIENETKIMASAKAGIEGIGEAEASTESRTLMRAAYNRQTGITEDTKAGGSFPFAADPHTYVECYLRWTEQTFQRRIKMKAKLDFGFHMGRWHKKTNKWASGRKTVNTLEDLIACIEQRGNPEMGWIYHHYARRKLNKWAQKALDEIQELRYVEIDRTTPPIKGADAIKVEIAEIITPDEDD